MRSLKKSKQKRLKAEKSCGEKSAVGHVVFTYTFSGGDVNRAGDVREAFIHAHLQVDDPATQEVMVQLSL